MEGGSWKNCKTSYGANGKSKLLYNKIMWQGKWDHLTSTQEWDLTPMHEGL